EHRRSHLRHRRRGQHRRHPPADRGHAAGALLGGPVGRRLVPGCARQRAARLRERRGRALRGADRRQRHRPAAVGDGIGAGPPLPRAARPALRRPRSQRRGLDPARPHPGAAGRSPDRAARSAAGCRVARPRHARAHRPGRL
ncbi:MAG: hypothetical protein AVDCRST_MAG38-232, partial [uncultured Solirubrobacteraceae bacterium]